MNETTARRVLLIQAFETAAPNGPWWTAEDRQWASRVARESAGPTVTADTYLAQRAHHAMQRLGPRVPALARWVGQPGWRWQWLLVAIALGLVAGVAADSIGSAQRINLLAPPLWALVAWNLVVYALLLWNGVAMWVRRRPPKTASTLSATTGALRRAVQHLIERSVPAARQLAAGRDDGLKSSTNPSLIPVLDAYATHWSQRSAPLLTARAAAVLHAAAAALAVGLIAGLYVRGLVLDYRVGWQSTFLDATQVHAGLSALLGPVASAWAWLAPAWQLPALQLPDLAAVEALRISPTTVSNVTAPATAQSSAASWIHLYALALALLVVLPRSVLVGWNLLRAAYQSRRFALPLADSYFQRLMRQHRGSTARLLVRPHAHTPSPAATLGLRQVLATVFGDDVQLDVLPTTAYGSSPAVSDAAPNASAAVALFDMAATPEAESQGRFVRALPMQASRTAVPRQAAPPALLMLVDESAFRRRFANSPERITQRRHAWQQLAASLGCVAVLVDLEQPDLPAAERAVQSALDQLPRVPA